jgi:uncharacterized protein (DUF433 family)
MAVLLMMSLFYPIMEGLSLAGKMPKMSPTLNTLSYLELVHTHRGTEIRIAGTAITVEEIVMMHLINESPIPWISENFDLSPAQIHAALAYHYDHQAEIMARIEAKAKSNSGRQYLEDIITQRKTQL